MSFFIKSVGDIRNIRRFIQSCEEQCHNLIYRFTKYQYAQMLDFADNPRGYPAPSVILGRNRSHYDLPITMRELIIIVKQKFETFLVNLFTKL